MNENTATVGFQDRIKELRRVPASELIANPKNWRKHPAAQRKAMNAILAEIGFAGAVLAREDESGRLVLIDGHLRAEAVSGADVPVLVLDVTEAEADKILATFDPLSAMAEIDSGAWSSLIDGITFTDADFGKVLGGLRPGVKPGKTDEDAIPEPPKEPVTRPGDLWILGDHRILCGDSTNTGDVARLMNGEKAALMATDPPYLVDYQGGNHPQSWANRPDVKDKHWDDYVDPDKASDFFSLFMGVALPHLEEYAAIYQWHASSRQMLVQAAWEQNSVHVHQTIIWVKARPVLTRCHYMWQFEPAFYGWKKGKSPKLKPPANSRNVWEIDQQGEQDGIHPTQKPVELFRRPLQFHTKPGGLAYEPFSGSGTAIIAAENTGRRVFAMELSPQFVDVAVQRWEEYSGQKATVSR